jgi:SagB-type dehydrogenase family enzyme
MPKNESIIYLLEYRRTIRKYKKEKIELKILSSLLKISVSLIKENLGEDNETKFYLRPFPSAGALNSINVYIINIRLADLEKYGVYYYDPKTHELIFLNNIKESSILETLPYHDFILDSGFIIILSGNLKKINLKYGSRGYRYVLFEAGHVMQNIYLSATALDLGVCAIGGFLDDTVNSWILADGVDEVSLYLACVGIPKEEK